MSTPFRMNDDLFHAILALDVYNRGYNSGINELRNSFAPIGRASFYMQSNTLENSDDRNAGLYAASYLRDGKTIISFRGTDRFTTDGATGEGSDITNGWTVGAGFGTGSQAARAKSFFELATGSSVYTPASDSVSVTGHSLGGGLAGFVSVLSGASGVIFDHMPFHIAAIADLLEEARRRNGGELPASLADVGLAAPRRSH